MDYAVVFLLKMGVSVAELTLVCLGLAVIFGMMGIINLAHGEFLMIGAYSASRLGVNLWIAMPVVAPVVTGCLGALIERLVIRRLYGRMIDTMLGTWGIGLILVGVVNVVYGSATSGVSAPLGSLAVGDYTVSLYEVALIPITVAVILAIWLGLRFTRIGLSDLRHRRRPARLGRCVDRSADRRGSHNGSCLHRAGLHHGHQRRRLGPDGNRCRLRAFRQRQDGRRIHVQFGHRRYRSAQPPHESRMISVDSIAHVSGARDGSLIRLESTRKACFPNSIG